MAKVAEATGTAGGSGLKAAEIEAAMVAATEKAMAEGITDPEKILELKMKARQDLKDREAAKEAAKAAKK